MDITHPDTATYQRSSTPSFWSLKRYLPSALIRQHNPLFDHLLRRMRWPRGLSADQLIVASSDESRAAKIRALMRYTRRYGLIVPIIIAVIGLLFLFGSADRNGYYLDLLVLSVGIVGALAFSLLCDLYYVVIAINVITQQARLEQWELLRLTNLTKRDILLAALATIQIRAWRVTVVEIGIRVCLSGIMLATFVYLASLSGRNVVISLLTLSALIFGFIFEPTWRMRAVTLIGMTITTWLSGYTTAIMTAFAALVGLLILRVVVLFGSIWLLFLVVQPLFAYYENLQDYYEFESRIVIQEFLLVAVAVTVMYLFLKGVQRATFGLLTRVAFRG